MNGNGAATASLAEQPTLPRGRHGIPRELVISHQRERMLSATTAGLREHGYADLSIAHITTLARVSRATFYKSFEDKLDCVLAAHGAAVAGLERRVREAYGTEPDWARGMGGALMAVLSFAAEQPDEMHLILFVNSAGSEPKFARFGLAIRERLIAAVDGARGAKAGGEPSTLQKQAALGAVIAVIGSMLQEDEAGRLPEFHQDLLRLILSPYLGEGQAKRIANGRLDGGPKKKGRG